MKKLRGMIGLFIVMLCSIGLSMIALASVNAGPFTANVEVTGRKLSTAETYTINMVADDASYPMPTGASNGVYTASIDGAGSVVIPEITYDIVGIYTYKIYQTVANKNSDATYDETVYKLTVSIINDENGSGIIVGGTSIRLSDDTSDDPNTKFDSADFTNHYAGTSISVKKVWDDDENEAGQRPESIEVQLLADGTPYGAAQSISGGDWAYTWTDLPSTVWDSDGNKHTVVYTVSESYVKGYTAASTDPAGSGTAEDPYSFTNTISKKTVTFEATKTLTGRQLKDGEFSFTVKDENGDTVAAGSNVGNNITFSPSLTYTIADEGEHVYYITEDAGQLGGVAYDTSSKKVTVTVTDNQDGTISTDVKYEGGIAAFTNVYTATGEIELKAAKAIVDNARALNAGEFSFTVTEDGEPVASGTNDADGNIVFSTIKYTLDDVGTHTYTVSEDKGQLGGITYDTTTFDVTVVVSDNGDGTLTAKASYPDDVTFNNIYEATGNVTFNGTKKLTGRTVDRGEFTFTVKEVVADGETTTEVYKTSGANTLGEAFESDIAFGVIEYTLADVGTHTYIITEDDNGKGGVTYSDQKYEVTVEVSDNGNGTLKTVVTYPNDATEVVFDNSYAATGSYTLKGQKSLSGRTMDAGEFSFTVVETTDENESEAETAASEAAATGTNDDEGNITFSTINYTLKDVGTHTYKVTEDNKGRGGVTYDDASYTLTVEVSDNRDGNLNVVATITNEDGTEAGVSFENTYEADGSIKLEGTKNLTGRLLNNKEFEFIVEETKMVGETEVTSVVSAGTNDTEGNITFDTISYDLKDLGEHIYTVTEKLNTTLGGITYSTQSYQVKVTVTDGREGKLNTKLEYLDEGVTGITFDNVYEAEGEIVLRADKVLVGRTMDEGEFYFIVTEDGEEVASGTNDKDGVIGFSTISYNLNDLGEHTYVVSERKGDSEGVTKGGVTYDTMTTFEVKVTVTDNGDGTLTATPAYPENGVVFTNNYEAYGSIELVGTKTLEGRTLRDGEFNFIVSENGQTVANGANDAEGNITFSKINYELADVGTHTYVLSEVTESLGGVTYSSQMFTVTVVVTDNRDGTLKAEPAYPDGGAAFTNTYAADGSVNLQASKSLTGRTLKAGEFSFTVSENGSQILKASNDANGVVSFDTINYTLENVGTHTYTISEDAGSVAGVTYDTAALEVTVVVTDNGDGTLGVAVTYPENGASFTNVYEAAGKAVLTATKNLVGRELAAEEFSFTVKENGKTVAGGRNAADGTITFSEIAYDLSSVGTHTYVISEDAGDVAGVTYDTNTYEVTVVVTDNGDSTLNAEVTYPEGGVTFNNPYAATGSVTIEDVTKTLDGRDLEDGEFSFIVTEDGTTVATGSNDEDGAVSFSEITYDLDDVGTHTYTVSEVAGNTEGITYDDATFTVTVVVSDNGDGTLNTEVTYPKSGIEFENSYAAEPAEAEITLTKKLEGGTLREGQFTFVLKNSKGKTVEKVTNAADGSVTFSALEFTEAGEYTYTVEEVNDGQSNITYDTTVHTVVIKVTDDGDGELEAKITSGDITFTNKYVAETETNPPTTTTPKTGDSTPIALYAALMAAALFIILGAAVVLVRRRRA